MEYKTLVGALEDIDAEMNKLASDGWAVHTHACITVIDAPGGSMPIFSVLMQRIPFVADNEEGKTERKFIGRR
jgi:hypothetical protein